MAHDTRDTTQRADLDAADSDALYRRVAALERRTRLLEDHAEITRVVLSYGPLVDAGDASAVAELWEPDGTYDVDGLIMSGQAEIDAMVRSTAHRSWVERGCAHFLGPPHITVSGDDATAVCYSLMVVNAASDGFALRRVTANDWRLHRRDDGWRVMRRTSRRLDGRASARELLARGAAEPIDSERNASSGYPRRRAGS